MNAASPLHLLLALVLAPALLAVTSRTKAVMAGRIGQPLLQPYRDLVKLLRKGAVYSRTTTWVFRAGPVLTLAAAVVALALVPFAGAPAVWSFPGDVVLVVYLLGVMRFVTTVELSSGLAGALAIIYVITLLCGAYPSWPANFWPSVSAHFMKSTIAFDCALSFGFSYNRSQVNDEIG